MTRRTARRRTLDRPNREGACDTIEELVRRERVNRGCMSRVLRLTLFAPDIVEAIPDGTQGPEVALARVLEPFIRGWERQRSGFG